MTKPNGTDASPFVKAATRDTKAYMKSKNGRYIPLGYSAADIATIRPMFQNYLVCGPSNETIDRLQRALAAFKAEWNHK